jgi:transcriptional regulator with XRE-family HTH domain
LGGLATGTLTLSWSVRSDNILLVLRDPLIELARERRRRLGWTQRELAAVLGSSPSRVSKLEAKDPSVSLDLVERALEAMATPLRVTVPGDVDVLAEPGLDAAQRVELGRELLRRQLARRIAAREGVDPDDVRHALRNLELTPLERLSSMFRRARLAQHAIH